jgi:hypothetical protein
MIQDLSEPTVANFVQKSFEIISVKYSSYSELIKFRHHLMAPHWKRVHY